MCILDRSRYTACCGINHIFRTRFWRSDWGAGIFLRGTSTILIFWPPSWDFYPSISNSSICNLVLLLKHWIFLTMYTVKYHILSTSYQIADLRETGQLWQPDLQAETLLPATANSRSDAHLYTWSTQPALSTTCNQSITYLHTVPVYTTSKSMFQEITAKNLLQRTAHLFTWVVMNLLCTENYVYGLTATVERSMLNIFCTQLPADYLLSYQQMLSDHLTWYPSPV